jgi:hypothetical protein
MTRVRHAQPIQATAVQDSQLAVRIEQLGAEDGVLDVVIRW